MIHQVKFLSLAVNSLPLSLSYLRTNTANWKLLLASVSSDDQKRQYTSLRSLNKSFPVNKSHSSYSSAYGWWTFVSQSCLWWKKSESHFPSLSLSLAKLCKRFSSSTHRGSGSFVFKPSNELLTTYFRSSTSFLDEIENDLFGATDGLFLSLSLSVFRCLLAHREEERKSERRWTTVYRQIEARRENLIQSNEKSSMTKSACCFIF